LTESWCRDVAQNIPIIEKIAGESVNITSLYVLGDENLELMNRFLTDGPRSVPKLIALDAETLSVTGTWGLKPAAAQELFYELRAQGVAKPLIMENLQRWYNADKGQTSQTEFLKLIEQGEGSEQGKVNRFSRPEPDEGSGQQPV
jgi:exonuclease I